MQAQRSLSHSLWRGTAGTGPLCKGPYYQSNEPRPSKCPHMTERLENLHLTNPDKFTIKTIITWFWCLLGARYRLDTDFHSVNHMVIPILWMRQLRSSR